MAIHLDMLEGVTENAVEDDDEYDEFEELDDDNKGSRKKRRRVNNASSNSMPKYLKARSLASILIEEASRSDSVAKEYVGAAVRRLSPEEQGANPEKTNTITKPYPPRKFCPVTGLYGSYTDPKSGIPYASLSALEQIKERAPPWMNASSGGTASYWEAMKTLKNDL